MIKLTIVLVILLLLVFAGGMWVINTRGYWLIDKPKELTDVQKQQIFNRNHLGELCKIIAGCLFSLCLYIVAVWLSCYFKYQGGIVIASAIEFIALGGTIAFINFSKRYKNTEAVTTVVETKSVNKATETQPVETKKQKPEQKAKNTTKETPHKTTKTSTKKETTTSKTAPKSSTQTKK